MISFGTLTLKFSLSISGGSSPLSVASSSNFAIAASLTSSILAFISAAKPSSSSVWEYLSALSVIYLTLTIGILYIYFILSE